MFELKKTDSKNKTAFYADLFQQAQGLFYEESDLVANAANLSSLMFNSMYDVNWVGFYFYKNDELVLGPFQGLPACIRIKLGQGVCGTAAKSLQTQLVNDVQEFEGHIACDAATRSELVVPLIMGGELLGVLDIDSPVVSRFDEEDKMGVEKLTELFVKSLLK